VAVASAGLYASLHLIPDSHANIPPLSFFTGRMPFLTLNQQRQSTEGRLDLVAFITNFHEGLFTLERVDIKAPRVHVFLFYKC